MILSRLTWQAKLIVAFLMLASIAFSYVWVYHQGQEVQKGKDATAAMQVVANELSKAAAEAKKIREDEVKAARRTADAQHKADLRLINDLKLENDILSNEANKQLAATPIPDDLVKLLNNSRGSTALTEGDD